MSNLVSNLVEFSLNTLLEAAEAAGWEVEVIQKHFPAEREVVLGDGGELQMVYIEAYCNTELTINMHAGEPIIFWQSYIKEFGPKYWMYTNTTNTQNHRNILALQRLGIPYSTVS